MEDNIVKILNDCDFEPTEIVLSSKNIDNKIGDHLNGIPITYSVHLMKDEYLIKS